MIDVKVIFLDIDGVLNSARFDREKEDPEQNIDVSRLVFLKELIDKTGALVVLSSTWRKNWDKKEGGIGEKGKKMVDTFTSEGIEIYDKTGSLSYVERSEEIKIWLSEHPDVEKFVIFDDEFFRWGDLSDNLVHIKNGIGRGLDREHIEKAMEILK